MAEDDPDHFSSGPCRYLIGVLALPLAGPSLGFADPSV